MVRARRRGFASMMAADNAQEMEVEGKRSGGKEKGRDQLKRNIKKKHQLEKEQFFFFLSKRSLAGFIIFFYFSAMITFQLLLLT